MERPAGLKHTVHRSNHQDILTILSANGLAGGSLSEHIEGTVEQRHVGAADEEEEGSDAELS